MKIRKSTLQRVIRQELFEAQAEAFPGAIGVGTGFTGDSQTARSEEQGAIDAEQIATTADQKTHDTTSPADAIATNLDHIKQSLYQPLSSKLAHQGTSVSEAFSIFENESGGEPMDIEDRVASLEALIRAFFDQLGEEEGAAYIEKVSSLQSDVADLEAKVSGIENKADDDTLID